MTSDLRATIARARNRAADDFYFPTDPDFLLILDAAERAQDARNAALEEAAKLADDWDERDGVWGVGTAIRALKETTHE